MPALLPNAAEIHSARAGAARCFFEKNNAQTGFAQRDGSGATGDPAAHDRDIGLKMLRHGTTPRIGIGLTGGWPRNRPTLLMSA